MYQGISTNAVSPIDGRATDIFGPGEGGPVFLSEVQCSGSETNLILCPSVGLGQHSCGPQNSTGVTCGKSGEWSCKMMYAALMLNNAFR